MSVSEDLLSSAFSALGDPTRRAIITHLTAGEATVNELAALFPISQQSVSRHVGVLKRCGLISQSVERQQRPCRLRTDTMSELTGWISQQQKLWEDRLDALERHLNVLQEVDPSS